jgi:putative membrane protein
MSVEPMIYDSNQAPQRHKAEVSELSSYLSNERTHLSYIRTAMSLVGFGLTLNRFSIYLEQSDRLPEQQRPLLMLRESAFAGLGMVILGSVILVWSLIRYRKVFRDLADGKYTPSNTFSTFITIMLLLTGVTTAFWMIMH